MAVEIGETHEMNVLLKNVRRELLLKVQAVPSLDEEKERMAIELVELKVQAVPSLDEEKERMAIELGEEEEVQKKRKEYDKMKVDVKKKPEGRLKRMKRRIRRLFCCVRDEHYE
ncbi:uncharacterized protein LOC125664950 [Ostrea edulis]|uniref:uncharacterized protein LOC125664950 n=1 Tax=Ostrea edulis TaxID=37623 RepID=UPI002095562F|nr:uncharacterized protein LOC125664950 [Ostrea edulis]